MSFRKYFWIIALLAGAGVANAAETTFRIATLAPDGSSWMTAMRAATDEITARTDNRVRFRFFPGGVMGNDESVLRKIRVGQLQGAALTGGSLGGVYPDSRIYGLPLLFRSLAEVDFVRARMDKIFNQGLEAAGFVNFGYAEGGMAYFMSSHPLRSVADLKQEKAWVPEGDKVSYALMSAMGVSPVVLPLADVPAGLQTGLLTAIASSPLGAVAFQWYTSVKYVTDVPLAYLVGVFVIDKRAFSRVSAADQQIVRDVLGATFRQLNVQNRQDNAQAREALVAQGLAFVEPSADEVAHWRGIAAQTNQQLATQGVFSAELLHQVQALLAEYRAQATPAGD